MRAVDAFLQEFNYWTDDVDLADPMVQQGSLVLRLSLGPRQGVAVLPFLPSTLLTFDGVEGRNVKTATPSAPTSLKISFFMSAYSYRSATMGSTLAARRAGM